MASVQEERLLSLLQSAPSGYFLVDKFYCVLWFNRAAPALYTKLTGGNLATGMDFLSLIIEERKGVVQGAIDAAFSGQTTEYEARYLRPYDGWIRARYCMAYDSTGQSTGVCITIDDITPKKLLEEKAHGRELKFLSLFQFSAIGMALVSPQGRWLDVNPTLEKITGYSKAELLGGGFSGITHPDDRAADWAFVQKMLSKEIDTYQLEKRYYHKNGSIVWILLTVSLVCHQDGSPDFFVSQIVDITATKQLIHELEDKNHNLDFATHALEQKIAQLEEFTHIAGHNLRGTVANIISLTGILREATAEEWPGWLDRLQAMAEGLLATLRELLAYTQVKLEADLPFEKCNIRQMCKEIFTQVTATDLDSGGILEFTLAFETVSYVRVYLQSILYNLFSNAWKYRKKNVPLIIAVTTDISPEGREQIRIADNGTGFDMDKHRDAVFKLNSTFHQGYNSKGIGLFITRAQVEKLGGAISVDSRVGEGTVFTIVL